MDTPKPLNQIYKLSGTPMYFYPERIVEKFGGNYYEGFMIEGLTPYLSSVPTSELIYNYDKHIDIAENKMLDPNGIKETVIIDPIYQRDSDVEELYSSENIPEHITEVFEVYFTKREGLKNGL